MIKFVNRCILIQGSICVRTDKETTKRATLKILHDITRLLSDCAIAKIHKICQPYLCSLKKSSYNRATRQQSGDYSSELCAAIYKPR